MRTYIDSSALVPVYIPERHSAAARAIVERTPQFPFTALHELEVSNAFALLESRQIITADERHRVRSQLAQDLEQERLVPVPVDWPEVFAKAGEWSALHSARLLTRSLDLMHVAAASALDCRVFVSADDRQLALAESMRLRVVDIKQHPRRQRR